GPREGEYVVTLPTFEGPLDLLLHLIQQHELDILDIPVSFVTEKYLEYLKLMRSLSIDLASEYLVMAATLAHIKSKMLLPSVPAGQDDDGMPGEEEDPRAELVRRLLEYQKYKMAAADLAERGTLGRDVFTRGMSESEVPKGPAPFASMPIFGLLDAFERVLKRTNVQIDHEVVFDRISITDRIVELTEKLSARRSMRFEDLLLDSVSKGGVIPRFEVVITFLAVLEMCKLRLIRVHQTDPLAPIHIQLSVPDGTPPPDFEVDEGVPSAERVEAAGGEDAGAPPAAGEGDGAEAPSVGGGELAEPELVEAAEPELVEAAEPELVEAAEPELVEAAEPELVEAAEPELVEAAEPELIEAAEPELIEAAELVEPVEDRSVEAEVPEPAAAAEALELAEAPELAEVAEAPELAEAAEAPSEESAWLGMTAPVEDRSVEVEAPELAETSEAPELAETSEAPELAETSEAPELAEAPSEEPAWPEVAEPVEAMSVETEAPELTEAPSGEPAWPEVAEPVEAMSVETEAPEPAEAPSGEPAWPEVAEPVEAMSVETEAPEPAGAAEAPSEAAMWPELIEPSSGEPAGPERAEPAEETSRAHELVGGEPAAEPDAGPALEQTERDAAADPSDLPASEETATPPEQAAPAEEVDEVDAGSGRDGG
ncbi:hypothetical protein BE18_39235, partial [Sorangium cellulosum]